MPTTKPGIIVRMDGCESPTRILLVSTPESTFCDFCGQPIADALCVEVEDLAEVGPASIPAPIELAHLTHIAYGTVILEVVSS